MEMIKRDKKEVAKDGVESTASQLQGGRLVGKVEKAARPWYERVKGTKYSASVDMGVEVSNSPDDTKKSTSKSKQTKAINLASSKGQEGSESWSSYDKTKSGEYMLSRLLKKPGGKEANEGDTTTTVSWKQPQLVRI